MVIGATGFLAHGRMAQWCVAQTVRTTNMSLAWIVQVWFGLDYINIAKVKYNVEGPKRD
jgi:hypothetical protein